MNRLQHKIALITGAARGIGAATAALFHHEGATVILTDIRDKEGMQSAADLGDRAVYKHLDVQHEDQWKSLSPWIEKEFGGIQILVNNAGITGFDEASGPFDPEFVGMLSWEKVHKVNLNGVVLGCKYGIRLMKKSGGSIINLSSRSGIVGIPGAVAYASSKAAVRNHTKSVALYCAQNNYNIRCNSIHPAAIMTPMWDGVLGSGELRDQNIRDIEAGIPLGHFGEPNDVAYAALYLASNESKYVTGIELHVDGGILAGSEASPKK